MFLSLNWLKNYVSLPKGLTTKKLAHDLTLSTVEVESVENQAEKFEHIVVGKIIEIKKHPNADKLKIVITDIGEKKPAQIVCGGINLSEGMFVAVALPGAKVRWHGEGELIELQETEIRGVKSFGMICSSGEIGLEKIFPCSEKEIVDLSVLAHIRQGQNLAQALKMDDIIIELDNKSITHRPDLWNHYGVARELSVIYKTSLKENVILNKAKRSEGTHDKKIKFVNNLSIKIEDKKLCPRYIGCVIKNVKIEKSPNWLIKKLEAVGLKPINNIVDITNYVMLDAGEPMHAFDKSKVKSQKSKLNESEIIIRLAKNGEKIKTLDEVTRKLDNSMLVIADSEKPIALAGIMGGFDSSVDEKTTEIILEAANFEAISVRKTGQKLGLRTEASNRFEKKLPVEFAFLGMHKALELIRKILPEAIIETVVDVNYAKQANVKIKIEHQFIEKRIGQKIEMKEVKSILERLGFGVKCQSIKASLTARRVSDVKEDKNYLYTIEVPNWRSTGDIDCPEDVVEEIARIYGYNNLKDQPLEIKCHKQILQKKYEIRQKIKDFLVLNSGLNEVFNYPWAEEIYLKKLGENGKMIEVANPPGEANKWLQNSLIPNVVKNIEDNLRYFEEFGIFEIANVYLPKGEEPKMLAIGFVSQKNTDSFLSVKGIIESMLNNLPVIDYQLLVTKPSQNYIDAEKYLKIIVAGHSLGWLGEMKKEIYQKFNFKNRNICLAEINLDELVNIAIKAGVKKYKALPQFPEVVRDLAFELDWQVRWESVSGEILKQREIATGNLSQDDNIKKEINFLSEFDLGNKKSLAFRIIYQANRTLTDKEVDLMQEKIIKLIEEKFSGRLRVGLKK